MLVYRSIKRYFSLLRHAFSRSVINIFVCISILIKTFIFIIWIEKKKLVVPWMVVGTFNILWCIIAVILFLASPVTPPTVLVSLRRAKSREKIKILSFKSFLKTASFAWEEIGIYLLSIVFSLYCILVVWSFFKQLKRNNQANCIL